MFKSAFLLEEEKRMECIKIFIVWSIKCFLAYFCNMTDTQNTKQFPVTKIIIGLILMAILIAFSLQNSTSTPIKLFGFETNAPLVILFLVFFGAGIFIGLLALIPINSASNRKSHLIKEQNNRIEILEKKLIEKNEF